MAADEYKALTFVHLPFLGKDGKTFVPGDKITREHFEKNADGVQAHGEPDGEHMTAEEQIAYFEKWGSISSDMDAELHPDHRPVNPDAPTLSRMTEMARLLVEDLEDRGEEIPKELRELADHDRRHVSAGEQGRGGDSQ